MPAKSEALQKVVPIAQWFYSFILLYRCSWCFVQYLPTLNSLQANFHGLNLQTDGWVWNNVRNVKNALTTIRRVRQVLKSCSIISVADCLLKCLLRVNHSFRLKSCPVAHKLPPSAVFFPHNNDVRQSHWKPIGSAKCLRITCCFKLSHIFVVKSFLWLHMQWSWMLRRRN